MQETCVLDERLQNREGVASDWTGMTDSQEPTEDLTVTSDGLPARKSGPWIERRASRGFSRSILIYAERESNFFFEFVANALPQIWLVNEIRFPKRFDRSWIFVLRKSAARNCILNSRNQASERTGFLQCLLYTSYGCVNGNPSWPIDLPQSVRFIFVSVPTPDAAPLCQLLQPNICKKSKIGVVLTLTGFFWDLLTFSFSAKPFFMRFQKPAQMVTIEFTERMAWESVFVCIDCF
jgi:hypothetical protein